MSAFGPVKVLVMDVAEPFADLDCSRGAPPPYASVWVFVCRSGLPLGAVELSAPGASIPAEELERVLRRALGTRWGREDTRPDPAIPRASVVVPTNLARPSQLHRCLERLARQDHPDYEVIVVDNRPAGAPPVILSGVRVIREPRPGISAARNRGLAEATGEMVAFTDDDVEAGDQWLGSLCRRLAADPGLAAVTGLVIPLELETPAQVLFEQSGCGLDRGYDPLTFERAGPFKVLRRNGDGTGKVQSLYATGEYGLGSNMAFRKTALAAVGGFDEALGVGTPTHGGEDLAVLIELLLAGRRIGYEPGAMVRHAHRESMADLTRQLRGYGVGFTAMLTALVLRHPRHIAGLLGVIPAWLRTLADPASGKGGHRSADYPAPLVREELRGMVAGPGAYLRCRARQRS